MHEHTQNHPRRGNQGIVFSTLLALGGELLYWGLLGRSWGALRVVWVGLGGLLTVFWGDLEQQGRRKAKNKSKSSLIIGLCVVEGGTDWFQASEDKKVSALFCPMGRGRAITARNKHKFFGRCQHGGTALVATLRLSGFIPDKGADSTGLGRFCWICVGSGKRKTWIVSAYQPC